MLFPLPAVIAAVRLASFLLLSLSSLAMWLQVDEQLRVVVAAVAAPLFALAVPSRDGRGRTQHSRVQTCCVLSVDLSRDERCKGERLLIWLRGSACTSPAESLSIDILLTR